MAHRQNWLCFASAWLFAAVSVCVTRAEDFDWRSVGGNWVTPVKLQDGGTCWAYSGVAAIESRLMLTRGDATWLPDLAEHQVVDRANVDLSAAHERGLERHLSQPAATGRRNACQSG